jgi:hypothetical protein
LSAFVLVVALLRVLFTENDFSEGMLFNAIFVGTALVKRLSELKEFLINGLHRKGTGKAERVGA